MKEEGYIKFYSHWERTALEGFPGFEEINAVRNKLFSLGYIGSLPDGVGFGNISMRNAGTDAFYISGTQTGSIPALQAWDYSLVLQADILKNRIHCRGLRNASSESMTHAAIYQASPGINAVIHIHNAQIWETSYATAPSTAPDIPYGTPEMAIAIANAMIDCKASGMDMILMKGHEDGLVFFGQDIDSCYQAIPRY